uniref:MFS transporter n=1 Tax=Cyberlindnera americana TaxID=36016 RepID=A0A5P8N8J5_9ASCO|nr:MFS transporter [Cyberlindnera americana]
MSQSPLLEADTAAFDDPSTFSAGRVAQDIIENSVDRIKDSHHPSYGTIETHNHDDPSSSQDVESQAGGAKEMASAELYVILSTLYMGSFLSALDTTIVTTLLSTIASEINAVSQMSWIASSYLLSCSAFQPLYGKLSDIYGRKPLLIFSNISFALGCLICGYSRTLVGLSIGRFITGIGGGGLTSLGVITTSDLIPLRKRGVYQGIGNLVYGSGAALGGLWGAFFQAYCGWEYAFYAQVPLSLLSTVLLWKRLNLPKGSVGLGVPGSKMEKLKQVDFAGSFFLVLSLLCFMMIVSFSGHEIAIGGGIFWLLNAVSLGAMGMFFYIELHVAIMPVIPVRLLAYRTVLSSSLVNWFMSMAVFTYLFYVPVFWSSVMQMTPTQIGLRSAGNFIGVSSGSFLSGLYMKRTGKYLKFITVTNFFSIIGVFIVYMCGRNTPVWFHFFELLLPGACYAAGLTVTLLALIAAVPVEHQAATTSIQYAFRSTGSTIGVSVASFIFQRKLYEHLQVLYDVGAGEFTKTQIAKIISKAAASAEYVGIAPEIFKPSIIDSYDIASHAALFFSVITMILAFVSGCFMQEHHLHTTIDRK